MIEAKNLTKYYGSRCAVKELSFSVEKGQIVGLLGPNGAGKSTTMKMLTGCMAPSYGSVLVEGYDLATQPIKARGQIGYLPEEPPLYQDMKVGEYLNFVAELRKLPKATRKTEVETASKQAGVDEVMGRLIRNLSKGYRQRVGLAAALVGHPPFLILDEPTVGLDPQQMIEMRQLIQELGKEHTVLLSSHILSEVSAVCDHILIVSGGELVAQGTPQELQEQMQASGGLEIVVIGQEEVAKNALAALEWATILSISAENDQLQIVLEMPQDTQKKAELSATLAQAGCPVISMKERAASLEEIFLQVTQNLPQRIEEQSEQQEEQTKEQQEQSQQQTPEEEQNESDL